MRRILVLAAALALAPTIAHAQSSPGFSYGQVPTAGQWNAAFASKQDRLTFTPLNSSGGTMTGRLQTAPSTINNAGLAILPGVAPTSPNNGDIWVSGSGLFARANNRTLQIANGGDYLAIANNLSEIAGAGSVAQGAARTNLGLGSLALQNANSVAISGGNINGTSIGGTAPAAAIFTTIGLSTPLGVTSGGTGAASLSLGLDAAFGSTRGNLLYRGSTGWAALGPGTVGQYLGTGGAGSDPAWGTPAGSGNVSTSGSPAAGQFAVFASGTTVKGVGAASFRNRLINGNFAINQRGASSASTAYAAGAYVMDRWKAGAGGVTLSFGTAPSGDVTVTITAGTLLQVIEGSLYLPEGGSYTGSWNGNSTCRAYQGAATGSYVASPITVSSWTPGTSGTFECSTGSLNVTQFEPGTQATPFERRDDETRRCQRYYGVYTGRLQAVATSAANGYMPLHVGFGAQMRTGVSVSVATSNASGAATSYATVANDLMGADVALGFSAVNTLGSATATVTASAEL